MMRNRASAMRCSILKGSSRTTHQINVSTAKRMLASGNASKAHRGSGEGQETRNQLGRIQETG